MVPFNDCEEYRSADYIDVSEALHKLRAEYLSNRHSKRLLLDLLESGQLLARGVREYSIPNVSGEARRIENIETEFWLRMEESWDRPEQGFYTNRFMSSGTSHSRFASVDDAQHISLMSGENAMSTNDQVPFDTRVPPGSKKFPMCYSDVKVSWIRLERILEQLDLVFDAVSIEVEDVQLVEDELPQVGRKMSERWPFWVGQACRLAHEHKFNSKTTANQVVDLVEETLQGAAPARSTVRRAAEEIVRAIQTSSVAHRFGR